MKPIKKLLIANRGEIACRVIRACKKLGISSVAVYSDADAEALHVKQADESVHIGPSKSAHSYLDIGKILTVAKQVGADAIHPGYGFLSENADFAAAVIKSGIVWIGPSPASIREMGDKQKARDIAIAAHVPVVPGSIRFNSDNMDKLHTEASRVGFPLLVKAAAGGGGIGMKHVLKPEDLQAAVIATQSLAKSAFGNSDVFLEKYIPNARHVEIQIFGFADSAVHFYERDCSTQRRFQKIIEEAPAPNLSQEVRYGMLKAAVGLANSVRYQGAGTVEFILDVDTDTYYFLEMNTRIQVEHPITEMTTGSDLVSMQIQLAQGDLVSMDQTSIHQMGHAIECRLYAENPAKQFMPSPGVLEQFDFAYANPAFIRIETGYEMQNEITPFYDPMIAKIIAYGDNRENAVSRLLAVLENAKVEGIKSNLSFLSACLRNPLFQQGEVTTNFVTENIKNLT
ncbi:acetyl-CoA carboxylase biotin carboxylase subunit [Paralcaligenes ureilyticus]|uniref:3-methylcrotonyl-CoA carboxylase alpha subunit n=1 Tax=Paralcaligenes ureilyticus TaxID=627131 RepID=A0A4R3M8D6_9BURK|nr:biotin carboxylase N-terminal domain-containing protein [Paralcaligenes ureilyticus]TCT09640.1 3-methylcrotonyl-CoA carboxylase alpha subunit [Paralcaligenes ureilyticus]